MVVLVCRDLLFVSKVDGAARAAGTTVKTVGSCKAAAAWAGAVRVAVVDLGLKPAAGEIAALRAACPGAKIVCFGSHVDVAALRAARAEGADEALPNSAFVQRLVEFVAAAPAARAP